MLRFTKTVKCLPEFEDFTVFLKNRNFISKIKRSKVTDYAALVSNFVSSKHHISRSPRTLPFLFSVYCFHFLKSPNLPEIISDIRFSH